MATKQSAKRILRVGPTDFARVGFGGEVTRSVAISKSRSKSQLVPVEGPVRQKWQEERVVCLPTLPCLSDLG